ncbi:5-methylcytosine-specific restriction endonuclease system specificity protein McrC [Psychrobacter alimentarius]|uniref:5-methylcytosine-specific restriction endonuclease system specificity protein McrC n=1 Tax=Psychrobacter alimentarius TaxID=261164 RepID=UPI00191ADBE4|nr:5-methylcytosine-specific restriction endonuclease system specificity protein McrC [Psychrobacter alimentarius]
MSVEEDLLCESFDDIKHIGKIPIRNLWLLILYASDLYRELDAAKVAVEDNPDDIPDLVAEILCRRVEHRVQRNLSYSYQSRDAVLNRVRGRIDLLSTERNSLLDRGKVACHFDELTIDTPRNRYVRTALETISKIVKSKELAHRCRSLDLRLMRMGVSQVRPSRSEVSVDRFGRHDIEDKPMVAAAHLAFNLALPTESAGTRQLSLPERDNLPWLRKLFEKGVAGFYDTVLSKQCYRISAGKILKWQISDKSLDMDNILPNMKTDIIIDNLDLEHRIVIDTKFNSIVTSGWYRDETLRSGYLYQMYAYLRSQEGGEDLLNDTASGLLLHPSVGEDVNEYFVMQNHKIQFATVDLGATAIQIRERLLNVIGAD